MRIVLLAMCVAMASCGGGSSMPTPAMQGAERQISYDDSGIIDPKFLTNSPNDFWICTYSESDTGIIFWQAPVKFHENGSGEAVFYGESGPTNFTWTIETTLNLIGQDLSLTLFDLDVDTNPVSRNQSYIGEIAANVAEGGTIACSKSIGVIF